MIKLKHGSEGNVISHFERVRRYGIGALCGMLVLGAVAACASDTAPQIDTSGTGGLQGILFFDANNDGNFDPSAGDTVLSNVHVVLQDRGTTDTIPGTLASTDATGRFSLTGVPIGSHSLAIDTAGIGTQASFCQNPLSIDIFREETQFIVVNGKSGCLITIFAAEAKPLKAPVTVAGTVTSSTGQIAASTTYIEDATGGIQVFGASLGSTLAIGDVVEVQGVMGSFNNETEITSPKLNSRVSGGPAPVPTATTTKKIQDNSSPTTADLAGRLVKVSAAKITVTFSSASGGGRNATIDDGSGPTAIRLETVPFADLSGFATTYPVGKCYDITGIVRDFGSLPPVELVPRSINDIVEVACKS